MKQQVVIIGGGLGGLFTGAILSKEGFCVTILEKNAMIGGGLQTFPALWRAFRYRNACYWWHAAWWQYLEDMPLSWYSQ